MLLDLKMPVLSGFEVLAWWREQEQEQQRKLPIVVMSSSGEREDIQAAMALGATGYKVKPGNMEQLEALVQELGSRWLTCGKPAGCPTFHVR
jgi:two-component system response regulator